MDVATPDEGVANRGYGRGGGPLLAGGVSRRGVAPVNSGGACRGIDRGVLYVHTHHNEKFRINKTTYYQRTLEVEAHKELLFHQHWRPSY